MKKKVFVHIGYEKTGTTTLQKHYFPNMEGVFYLGKHYSPEGNVTYSGYEDVLGAGLKLLDDSFLDAVAQPFSESLFQKSCDKLILLSNESFTGLFPYFVIRNGIRCPALSPIKLAKSLKKLFIEELFDVYVIITIRRQYDILASRYAQSYQGFYREPMGCFFLSSFDKFKKDFFSDPENPFRVSYDFLRTVDFFTDVFGKDRILILPFELFKENHTMFFKHFCAFLGVNGEKLCNEKVPRENVRLAKDGTRKINKISFFDVLLRAKNKFIPRAHFGLGESKISQFLRKKNSPFQPNPGPIKFSEEEKERIKEIYFASNKALSQKYSLQLEEYGYF